jgi:hypothetical protein
MGWQKVLLDLPKRFDRGLKILGFVIWRMDDAFSGVVREYGFDVGDVVEGKVVERNFVENARPLLDKAAQSLFAIGLHSHVILPVVRVSLGPDWDSA